jgi:hypothetical protein
MVALAPLSERVSSRDPPSIFLGLAHDMPSGHHHRYGASISSRLARIGSHRSPLESSFSLL